ncbi:MAG: trigger factor [Eggerthellaceae bacterium]|nr:trigger factor [Eggerthellaceae bacterium]
MKVKKKKLEDGRVQLDVVADADDVARAQYQAQRVFASQMNLTPKKGKTIAEIANETMGIKDLASVVETQAIENLVPYAIDKSGLMPAYPPTAMPTSAMKQGKDFSFRLIVTPRPDYELSSYEPVTIVVPPFTMDETLVDKQMSEMASHWPTYEQDDGSHPVAKGDHVLVSIEASKDGERLTGLCCDSRTYTAGEGYMPEGFDSQIIGMVPGETKTFSFEGPNIDDDGNEITETIDCTVTVIANQHEVIPTINDEWVRMNMPMYKDLAGFRAALTEQLEREARMNYDMQVREVAAGELAKRFKGSIENPVYESMQKNMMSDLRRNLQRQGMTYEQYVERNGGQQQFSMMMMMQIRETLVKGYALDAVFRHEGLVVTDEDIEEICFMTNPQSPAQARKQFEESGNGYILRESAERLRATKWVVDHAIIKDPSEVEDLKANEADKPASEAE